MPTYEYECRSCGHRFEKFQSMTEKPIRTCPQCKGRVDRLIGMGGGVLFRGSGFHSTDYRSESYRKAKEKEKPSSADGSGSGKGKDAGS
jgi:putative FmdB family regulatory protein